MFRYPRAFISLASGLVLTSVLLTSVPTAGQTPTPEAEPEFVGSVRLCLTLEYAAPFEQVDLLDESVLLAAITTGLVRISASPVICDDSGMAVGDPAAEPVSTWGMSWAELQSNAKRPKYADLLRNPSRFEGQLVYFKGIVTQALEAEMGGQDIFVCTPGNWDMCIAVHWEGEPRVIPTDSIELVMTSVGNWSYDTASMGGNTVPAGIGEGIRIVN